MRDHGPLTTCVDCRLIHYTDVQDLASMVRLLSDSEYELFVHMAGGPGDAGLAGRLLLSERTVRKRLDGIRGKLEATRHEVMIAAYDWNWQKCQE